MYLKHIMLTGIHPPKGHNGTLIGLKYAWVHMLLDIAHACKAQGLWGHHGLLHRIMTSHKTPTHFSISMQNQLA